MKKPHFKKIFLGIIGIGLIACSNPFLAEKKSTPGNPFLTGYESNKNTYFTVRFAANGGNPAPGNQRIAWGAKIAKLPVMSKENFGFGGWFTDSGLTKEWNLYSDRVVSDVTLYAKWNTPYHTVNFETNGGTPTLANQNIMEGALIPEPGALRKSDSGFWLGFGGWYTEPELKNQWNFAADRMSTNDITLYARWGTAHCTVTFEANQGSPDPRPQELIWGSAIIEPPAMNREGYGFGGWYRDPGFTREWNFASDTVSAGTNDLILYAKWVTNYYTVKFNANGGVPAPANQTVPYGTTIAKPPAMKNPGMGFVGWYTNSSFTNEWDFDLDTVSGDMTLYAKWDTARYTVKFDSSFNSPTPGYGNPMPGNQLVAYNAKISEPPIMNRAGYCFAGWYTGGGYEWDFDTDLVTDAVIDVDGNLTLYSRWVPFIEGMVWVQKGSFMMGDNAISGAFPAHKVLLTTGYYIGKYPVTQQEYEGIVSINPSNFKAGLITRPVERVSWYDTLVYCNRRSINEGLTPVYTINGSTNPGVWGSAPTASPSAWDNVLMNIGANGYRLPTEAEWEYTAIAGKNFSGGFVYSGSNNPDDVAWYNSNSGGMTHPVGTKAPNSLGIYDMSGNVSEWCWDRFDLQYYSNSANSIDPKGPLTGNDRVRRGGSWNNANSNIRLVVRNSGVPYNGTYVNGFRVVRRSENLPQKY